MASRELSIQTGVVQRLQKEVVSYQKEAEEQRRTADKMQAEGTVDEGKIRQQWKALQETLNMIPDSQQRLGAAVQSLKDLVTHTEENERETEEWQKAQETIEYAYQ